MNHRRFHWLEKTQVQLATVAAMAVVYFAVWPGLRPSDPVMPLSFLAVQDGPPLATFVLLVAALAAAVGLLTVTARAEGALMAVLLGAGAASLRSPDLGPLLRLRQDDIPAMFHQLALEVLLLAALVLLAAGVIMFIRIAVGRIFPRAMWRSPIAKVASHAQEGDALSRGFRVTRMILAMGLGVFLGARLPRESAPQGAAPARSRKAAARCVSAVDLLTRACYCLLLGGVIATAMLMLLMRSDAHGQVVFAVLVSFVVAMLVAHQVFPGPFALVGLVMPVAIAVALYFVGAQTVLTGQVDDWAQVPVYVKALPIDWMTFGTGGALLGYWFSCRINETRHIEAIEKTRSAS